MSNATMAWALGQWLDPYQKMVLVAIADCVNHTSDASFPALDTIAEMACQSRRSVQRHIAALEELGLLVKEFRHAEGGRQTSNLYRINMDIRVTKAGESMASDEGEGDRLSPSGGCQIVTLGGDTGDTLGGDTGVTPINRKNNPKRNDIEREARAKAEEDEPAIAGKGDEAFSAFFEAWPTAATDSRERAWKAWQALKDGERRQAAERINDFQEFAKKQGRKYLIAADTYLRERRFINLPKAAASAGPVGVEIKLFSREFFALLVRYFERDDVQERTRLFAALKAGRSHWMRAALAPTQREVDALVFTPLASERVEAWKAAFKARGLVLPLPNRVEGVFLPPNDPPEDAPRRIPPEAMENLRKLGINVEGDRR